VGSDTRDSLWHSRGLAQRRFWRGPIHYYGQIAPQNHEISVGTDVAIAIVMSRLLPAISRTSLASLGLIATLVVGCGSSDSKSPTTPDTVARSAQSHDANPNIADTDYQAVVAANNQFGFDLLLKIVPGETGNLVYSATSAVHALSMTYLGAQGATKTQMAAVLHDSFAAGVYPTAINRLTIDLASRNLAPHSTTYGDLSVTLKLVDDIWSQNGFTLAPTFLDDLAKYYDAGVHLVDFIQNSEGARTTINQWVADHTANRIQNLLPSGSVDASTRLVLSNALYFKGSWAEPFDANSTSNAAFNRLDASTVDVPMMHDSRSVSYGEGTDYQIVDVPFDGGQLSMTLLLPAAGHFTDIRDQLSQQWWSQATAAMANTSVTLTVPKFSFTWGTESLADALKGLGMTDAFDEAAADFSGIEPSRQLYVGDVLQKAFIAVDESGAEAAAATAVTMRLSAAPLNEKTFAADRPFLCFIRDTSGEILFAAQVLDPSAS
jgi:serpin B